jgi:hypothetical protein
VDALVADTGISSMRSPNTLFSATYSFGSPTGVDVACG